MPTPAGLVRYSVAQMEALAELPQSILTLNRSINTFAQAVGRLDELVRRIDRLTALLEAPVVAIVPRLEALIPLFDEKSIGSALDLIGETQAQVASIARSAERLTGVVDDTFSRLADLPGANLVNFLRGGSPTPASEKKGASPPTERKGPTRGTEETRGWKG